MGYYQMKKYCPYCAKKHKLSTGTNYKRVQCMRKKKKKIRELIDYYYQQIEIMEEEIKKCDEYANAQA
jgi:hypothetical protein